MATETIDDVLYVLVSTFLIAPSVVKEPASVAIPVNHAERPKKFNGQNFKEKYVLLLDHVEPYEVLDGGCSQTQRG